MCSMAMNNGACCPGNNDWTYCHCTLSFWVNLTHLKVGYPLICGYPIFQKIAMTWQRWEDTRAVVPTMSTRQPVLSMTSSIVYCRSTTLEKPGWAHWAKWHWMTLTAFSPSTYVPSSSWRNVLFLISWKTKVIYVSGLGGDNETYLSCLRHQMEIFSTLQALCAGNSPVTGEFPSQRPAMRSFDNFFNLGLNKRLSKQWRCRWFETPSPSLWHHCDVGVNNET